MRSRFKLTLAASTALALGSAGYLSIAHAQQAGNRAQGQNPQQIQAGVKRAANDMASAATAFWNALTPEQQAKAGFEFKNDERVNWHFVPRERKGLPLREMTPPQQQLAFAFLSTGLGQRGFVAATTIMSLDQILKEIEGGRGPGRDAQGYFFSVFGKPGESETWGWRVEGHHLALNFTIVNGSAIAIAPTFFGTNPAEVREGPRKGLRTLAVEEDLGRAFAKSLDEDQRKTGFLAGDVPKDILTGNSRKAKLDPAGIPASELQGPQRQKLMAMIREHANRHRREVAQADMQRIQQAGVENIRFLWAGDTEPGKPHYYRIHGPTFLIEYDNTQNNANHVHSVWRDLTNDFGDDLLAKHYAEAHNAK